MNTITIIGIVCGSLLVALILFEIIYSQSNRWWRFKAKPGDKCYFSNCYGDKTWYMIYGSAAEIEDDLWQILICCMASDEADTFKATDRANFMQLYKQMVTLLYAILPKEVLQYN